MLPRLPIIHRQARPSRHAAAILFAILLLLPSTLPAQESSDRPRRVALVLSGGGARGFAQIGVLKVLEEAGIRVDAIVGTSIGALVGGLYAGGYTARELDSIARSVDWNATLGVGDEASRSDLLIDQKMESDRSLLTLRLDGLTPQLPEAVSSGAGISRLIEHLVWGGLYHDVGTFDDLKIPFRAVATDLVSGRAVVLDSGNLALAIRASATVPLRFAPIRLDSMLLVDGGLVTNVPVDIAAALGCDVVIVVNTTSPLLSPDRLDEPLNVADQVVTVMMQRQTLGELGRASLVITPTLGERSSWSFDEIDTMIAEGERAARAALDTIVRLVGRRAERGDDRRVATLGSMPAPHVAPHSLVDRIEQVSITGLTAFDSSEVIESFIKHAGDGASDPLRAAGEALVRRARARGFAFFNLAPPAIDSGGTLHLDVDEGRIRSIRFEGLERCSRFVVDQEFGLDSGDIFTIARADRGLKGILRTGYFSQAHLDVARSPAGGVDIVVRLRERGTALVRFSASVDNEHYTQVGVELAQENLFGQGTRVAGRFGGGLRDRFVELGLRSNRIYGSAWTFGVTAYGERHEINVVERRVDPVAGRIDRPVVGEYLETRLGTRARLGRNVGSFGLVSVEGRFERQGASSLSSAPPDDRWRSISTLRIGIDIDSRDRMPYPRSGGALSIGYETSQALFGADASFARLTANGEYYQEMGRHVLRPRVALGFADETLPAMEHFSLGGQFSMFGLRQHELRGRQLFLASLSYRYHLPVDIFFDTYLGLRYDLGSAWGRPSEIRLGDLEHAIGGTLSIDTPVGPADFALGQSFTVARPGREAGTSLISAGPLVAYFSLGYRFD